VISYGLSYISHYLSEKQWTNVRMSEEIKDSTDISSSKKKIDLSVGLEAVSPIKSKRGSVDLSAGLDQQEETSAKSNKINGIPSKFMTHGLQRQVSVEETHNGEDVELSHEQIMALLQPGGDGESSSEAWEVKASAEPPR
jgi:hypothetical protein